MVSRQHCPLVRVAKVDQGPHRFLNACDKLNVGSELDAVVFEQGKLTLSVWGHSRKPCSLLQGAQWRGRTIVSGMLAPRGHPQCFADPAQNIFAFPRVHRVLQ
jgi:hypothetical protein